MKHLEFLTVRLDVRSKYDGGKLDASVETKDIKEVCITYYNRGEGDEWEASVPFTIVKEELLK